MELNLEYVRLNNFAYDPVIGSKEAVGVDLKTCLNYILEPKKITKIQTGLKIKFPENCFGKIENRSSMALKNIEVKAGIIDPDYTGEIIILLYNNNDYPINIIKGDKVAQIVCYNYTKPNLKEVDNIKDTERNIKGFGSSGR